MILSFAWVQNDRFLKVLLKNGIVRWWNLDESLNPKKSSKGSPAPLNIPTPSPAGPAPDRGGPVSCLCGLFTDRHSAKLIVYVLLFNVFNVFTERLS